MTSIIDLEEYRQELADLDEYASLLAEQYEAICHEPPEEWNQLLSVEFAYNYRHYGIFKA